MSKLLSVFRRRDTNTVANEIAVIKVPDIKEHLVREYERCNELKLRNEALEKQLENARELELKYKAALVTLDEYSKRLEVAKLELQRQKDRTEAARAEADKHRDLVNSYKIKLADAAITMEQMAEKIASAVKANIIGGINAFKGNLSKEKACEIVRTSGIE